MSKRKPESVEAIAARAAPGIRLLMPSEDVRRALGGISIATVRRLEQRGLLKPVRLMRSLKAVKYYTPENVEEVARGQDCSGLSFTEPKPKSRDKQPRRRRSREDAR